MLGATGALGLAANVASMLILMRCRNGDVSVRSVWLCSRNNAVRNVAVMLAALGVWATATKWPDLIVAGFMAALFLSSSVQIIRQAMAEPRAAKAGADIQEPAHACCEAHQHASHAHQTAH